MAQDALWIWVYSPSFQWTFIYRCLSDFTYVLYLPCLYSLYIQLFTQHICPSKSISNISALKTDSTISPFAPDQLSFLTFVVRWPSTLQFLSLLCLSSPTASLTTSVTSKVPDSSHSSNPWDPNQASSCLTWTTSAASHLGDSLSGPFRLLCSHLL